MQTQPTAYGCLQAAEDGRYPSLPTSPTLYGGATDAAGRPLHVVHAEAAAAQAEAEAYGQLHAQVRNKAVLGSSMLEAVGQCFTLDILLGVMLAGVPVSRAAAHSATTWLAVPSCERAGQAGAAGPQ